MCSFFLPPLFAQWQHVFWGRRGHNVQNINTPKAAANRESLVNTDNRQYEEQSDCFNHHKLLWRGQRQQNFPWHFILQVIGRWQQKMSRLSYSSGISSHTDWGTMTLTGTTLSAGRDLDCTAMGLITESSSVSEMWLHSAYKQTRFITGSGKRNTNNLVISSLHSVHH